MKRSSERVFITNPNPNRNVSTSHQLARRLALLAIAALLIGMSFGLRSMRVVRASTITVTAGPDVDAANNDFKRIQNAIDAAMSGDTIMLSGTFDFTQPFAAAAWALGNDNTAATADDYEVLVPAGVNNVTITASSLGQRRFKGRAIWRRSIWKASSSSMAAPIKAGQSPTSASGISTFP